MPEKIHIGNLESFNNERKVEGKQIKIENENFYKISNVDNMRPFFMSIVSNSNHWMFISSTGSLSAGRKNSEYALFPYYTDDKITESSETTGSKTILIIKKSGKNYLWEPFSEKYSGIYNISRNIYKNTIGNKIIFEEINHDLNIEFNYQWNSSNKYGFVRKSFIKNNCDNQITIDLLDGIQNILPYGVGEGLQNAQSNLVDAYKKCELDDKSKLALFSLSAIIVDKAEPSEALKVNTVWSTRFSNSTHLLSSLQLNNFRKGIELKNEFEIKAEKGAYFINKSIDLDQNSTKEWMIICNVNQTISDVVSLKKSISNDSDLESKVKEDIVLGSKNLRELVGNSDGLQLTNDKLRMIRHFSNTMFNIMRGGIFDDNYQIEKNDFLPYVKKANSFIYQSFNETLNNLPDVFTLHDLKSISENISNHDFKRLCTEYLPLKFSRRHGDPSRPWNKFSINTRSEIDGSKILDYQGNWRDIFQNWEALAYSYPQFIEGMIHKFLNSTTFDGYNPYRVTKDGFDWETIEPDNPWSYIGYWGDHQIIYLLKFLEFTESHFPNKLYKYFSKSLFVYANVPYRIKSYEEILKDSKNTIDYDHESESTVNKRRSEIGVDGSLLYNNNSDIHRVNFIEKILATLLAKVSNFVPEGGIWMNTQRPEWNDANNALVGNGISMVTLYYLRRFVNFFKSVLEKTDYISVEVSTEINKFFNEIYSALNENKGLLESSISDSDRKKIVDLLGHAGSNYRNNIYDNGFSGIKSAIGIKEIKDLTKLLLIYIDHSIDSNKRSDKLYHAYNLLTISDNEISISYLPEMLEGQVAVLSSGYLDSKENLEVLDALKSSKLFREDQYSYILYPNKDLGLFLDKNTIPTLKVKNSNLLTKLVNDGNKQIISKDCEGVYHFNCDFNNANNLVNELNQLPEKYSELVKKEYNNVLQIFEDVFNHKEFTGRSGTFFGYEGLGSIYWHMVSKLSLAVLETTKKAINEGDKAIIGRFFDHYFEILEGIGVNKSPELYGAFPTDPYSHTPAGKGAQQPGMTGQVKEDVISRFGELGVEVNNGLISFNPIMLRDQEFLKDDETFRYVNLSKDLSELLVKKDSLCFTYCQVPVIYSKSSDKNITINFIDGKSVIVQGNELDNDSSKSLFNRENIIKQINVSIGV